MADASGLSGRSCPDYPNLIAEGTHEHTYDDSKPPPPIQIVVQNPDGEVLLGEDSTRVLPACPSQDSIQDASDNSQRDLEALQRERQNDINGLFSLSMRRRKAASFFLCLDLMYMLLVGVRFVFNENRSDWDAVRVGTIVLACTAAVADVLCVIWLASSLSSKRTLVVIGVVQLLCCLGSAALLSGSTLILDFIRCLAIVQILRAWAAVVELQRLPTLPYRLPPTPASWRERFHYRLIGQRPPFYMGPRRAEPPPPGPAPDPEAPHSDASASGDSDFHSPASHASPDQDSSPAAAPRRPSQDNTRDSPVQSEGDVELQPPPQLAT